MIERYSRKLFSSKVSIISLFTILVILLTIPILLVFSQQEQDIRQSAAEPTPSLLSPLDANGYIAGYVFLDKNENGEREAEEPGIANVQIKVTQINQTPTAGDNSNADLISIDTTDSSGYFRYRLTTVSPTNASYSLKLLLPQNYKTINTNPVLFTNLPRNAKQLLQFGLFQTKLPAINGSNTQPQTISLPPKP
jgi:hypothetical protein